MKKMTGVVHLFLGAGVSIVMSLAGVLLIMAYLLLSEQGVYHLGNYFACILFLSAFCGGYTAGRRGGISYWMPAGLIGCFVGGLSLLLLYMLFNVLPTLQELANFLFLPAVCSSTGALVAANQESRGESAGKMGV